MGLRGTTEAVRALNVVGMVAGWAGAAVSKPTTRWLEAAASPDDDATCAAGAPKGCSCLASATPKPDWAVALEWVLIAVLLFLSACFSGLNLGLMSLDVSGLEILAKGEPDSTNARYAAKLLHIRRRHNFLLVSILFGNVATNTGISVLLADKTTGPLAFLTATFAIVILGEIIPQSICSRYPLWVGYHSLPLVYTLMVLLAPIAYPISRLLDCVLGAPLATIYASKELTHFLELHQQEGVIDKDQTRIMQGALEASTATVATCLTPVDELFMLDAKAVLDHALLREIFTSGFSRVPVFDLNGGEEGARTRSQSVRGILLVKDLILYDASLAQTVGDVASVFAREPLFFSPETTIARALQLFKEGKSHCAIVVDAAVGQDGPDPSKREDGEEQRTLLSSPALVRPTSSAGAVSAPSRSGKTLGMVTLEDVLEAIINAEIRDETDDDSAQLLITQKPGMALKASMAAGRRVVAAAAFTSSALGKVFSSTSSSSSTAKASAVMGEQTTPLLHSGTTSSSSNNGGNGAASGSGGGDNVDVDAAADAHPLS